MAIKVSGNTVITDSKIFYAAHYSDRIVTIGNTGTAANIDLSQGSVFTATLTGNATLTVQNAYSASTAGSSFILILTNDATPSRTVAFAGGSFLFGGGIASITRTATAGAVDVWSFFTPNNGTTWYGNLVLSDLQA